jgi:hypothetical protein
MGYSDSLPASFGQQVFVNEAGAALTGAKFGSSLDSVFQNPQFGVDTAGALSGTADALTGAGALGASSAPSWTFITAPEDVSWDIANQANRVDIFGTNNPPVVSGSRGMRDLTLGNALIEGFVRRKQVEDKVKQLESLMNYGLNTSDGFVSVPVYQIWANKKSYGSVQGGYFIIKDIRLKETMRDIQGNSTRVYADISLMQVPAYQVNTGRDQASSTTSGVVSPILPGETATQAATQAGNQNVPGPGSATSPSSPAAKPAAGPSAPAPAAPSKSGQGAIPTVRPNVPIP